MSVFRMVMAEIKGRPVNFLLSLTAVVTAVTLFIAGQSLMAGYATETRRQLAEMDKQTKRIMRDLGVNLRIVHRDTNMGSLYTNYKRVDFPEDYVEKLAAAPQINSIVHLLATLQERITWNDREIFLTGVLPVMTVSQKNEEKPHMIRAVEPGTVIVGHLLGRGRKVGETLEIEGHEFRIAAIDQERGTEADVQLALHLHDAQKVLGKPGRINEILALNCKCEGNRMSIIRKELEGVLPDTRVTEDERKATTREMQRDLVEKQRKREEGTLAALTVYVIPLIILMCAVFVGVQSWLNVRERLSEIGLLRALGKNTRNIAALFMMRSILMGLLGGVIGCVLGALLALTVGRFALHIPAELFRVDVLLIVGTLIGAPLVAAMAGYLPMLSAVSSDPAAVLMDR